TDRVRERQLLAYAAPRTGPGDRQRAGDAGPHAADVRGDAAGRAVPDRRAGGHPIPHRGPARGAGPSSADSHAGAGGGMTYLVLGYVFATLMLGGFLAVSLLQLRQR